MVTMKEIMKDVFSDVIGGTGITTMSIPFIVDITDILKLLTTIAGGILVFISIRYKLLLYKELKRQQEKEKHFKK